MKSCIVKIGRLWNGPDGAVEQQDFEVPLEFDPKEIPARGPVCGHMLLAKTKNEIEVVLSNLTVRVEFICQRCLKKFTRKMTVPNVERSFLAKRPADEPDLSDLFLIDMKDLTIDLYDMIRQEIILHFPLFSVCSKSCKGLCPRCGANWNEKSCACKQKETAAENKPFKDLKKLIK